jgi:cobaltochelatase CobT
MFRWLWSRSRASAAASSSAAGYRAFTTEHDVEIRAERLAEVIGSSGDQAFRRNAAQLDEAIAEWRLAADIAAIDCTDQVTAANPDDALKDTVASLLIDHSGSMKGQRAILAIAVAEVAADFWHRLGIRYEVLGFTTRSWKGGWSRHTWRWTGAPRRPGRLCDLLHIIYRSADDKSPGAPRTIRNLIRPELLKENVDGEAVQWAAQRLRNRPEKRKLLIVVSDGAPVDDSTLSANDPEFLDRHLREVVASINDADDVRLAGIGLDYELFRYYSEHVVVRSKDDLAKGVLPFLAGLLNERRGKTAEVRD